MKSRTLKFISKLYQILSNRDHEAVISWSKEGNSFIILNEAELPTILKQYYLSDNIKSFYRQLRLYSFTMSKNRLGIRQYIHPEFNIDFKKDSTTIFRKNHSIKAMTDEFNALKYTLQSLQFEQLQMLKKLQISVRIHKIIWNLTQQVKSQYCQCNQQDEDDQGCDILSVICKLFLSHNEYFHSKFTFEDLQTILEIEREVFTPNTKF